PNAIRLTGQTALSDAVFLRQTEIALYLLENGFNPLAVYIDPHAKLDRETWEEARSIPESFRVEPIPNYDTWLKRQRKKHSRYLGEGALYESAVRGNVEVLGRLLDLGMPVDLTIRGYTPLMRA